MKRVYSFLTSLPFMAFLFLLLAFSMAVATILESRYGTPAARSLVYNTRWFELIWILLGLNLLNNVFKYRLYTGKKLSTGIFHAAFLLILLGAGVTRFFSFEGMMHIREGATSGSIFSSGDYFSASLDGIQKSGLVRFSEVTPRQFSCSFPVENGKISIKTIGFIRDAEKKAIPSEAGVPVIDLVVSMRGGGGMQTFTLQKGERINRTDFSAGFEAGADDVIRFFNKGENLFLLSGQKVVESPMSGEPGREFEPGDTLVVQKMSLYRIENHSFLVRDFIDRAEFIAVKSQAGETGTDAAIVSISDGNREKKVPVFGSPGALPDTVTLFVDNRKLQLAWGGHPVMVPFRLRLNDFQLEKYPGSDSPSSYASEITLIDPEHGIERNVRIFMNNTLYYQGYKFFQSSYDRDEQGTILSVNHDFAGTWITYAGYLLLVIGILMTLLNRDSYFNFLVRKLKGIGLQKATVLLILTGTVSYVNGQKDSSLPIPDLDKAIVREFGQLWVQGHDGRIEPVSTLTSELIRKISRKSAVFGKSPNEIVLGMMSYPEVWKSLPVIKIANKTLAAELGATGGFTSLRTFFDEKGHYRISEKVDAAYNKAPSLRNRVEKEYIYVDERINIFFMILDGTLLNIYPSKDRAAKWHTPGTEVNEYTGGDSLFIKSGFRLLLESITGNKTGEAIQVLQGVSNFQEKYGSALIPSAPSKQIEILYNKVNPFKRVFPFYLLSGFLLLFILLMNVLRQRQVSMLLRKTFYAVILSGFALHTLGLIIRWYISGHAPWSNGYESIVYVAWAAMLAGLIFGRKYPMVVGTAALLSGIALFVAHLSWMNPEVTNLVPVLKSYWLTIHVAVITGSYGFIGLSAFLGILVLILMALRNRENYRKSGIIIDQLTTINEMSAMIGLYSLTIGTFLGAIWANESWGRYWGWDPKETWSLITILIYSFVVHMRMIPSLKGAFNFNMAAVIGFTSVLMTYFGVNYYLTGLHSYGSGVTSGIHWTLPVTSVALAILLYAAWLKQVKFEKNPV